MRSPRNPVRFTYYLGSFRPPCRSAPCAGYRASRSPPSTSRHRRSRSAHKHCRLVPYHRLRCRPRDARPLEVPHGGSPKVVRNPVRNSRRRAGRAPSPVEIPDRLSIPVKDPRHDERSRLLDRARDVALFHQEFAQPRGHREDPAVAVLRLPRLQPDPTAVAKINVRPGRMQSEGGSWRAAAQSAVEDVMAWWEANRTAVEQQQ